ncbi:hypothetical protein C8R44DRAFT_349659 [Mycena epipterygia]|nr:hypothetical protein C8R44DRAFT_349659 [Mycena epipterygia]
MHGRYPSALNCPSVTHTQPLRQRSRSNHVPTPITQRLFCCTVSFTCSRLAAARMYSFRTLRARIPGVEFSLQDPPCTVNRSRPALRGSSIFTAPALACCHPRRAAFPSPTLVLDAPKFGPQSRWRRLAHRARSQEPLLASTPCERPSQYTSPLTRSTSTQYPLSDIRSRAVITTGHGRVGLCPLDIVGIVSISTGPGPTAGFYRRAWAPS